MYVNDLNYFITNTSLRLYADDTTQNASEVSPMVLQFVINSDLGELSSWFIIIFLQINATKTQAIATLNFQKFKVALNPMYRICLNFAKSCISSCFSKFYYKKKFLNLKLRVFLAVNSVAMVIKSVTKIIPTFSPLIGQFFIPSLWHQLIKSGNDDPSKSTSWKVLETVLSHLMRKKIFIN